MQLPRTAATLAARRCVPLCSCWGVPSAAGAACFSCLQRWHIIEVFCAPCRSTCACPASASCGTQRSCTSRWGCRCGEERWASCPAALGERLCTASTSWTALLHASSEHPCNACVHPISEFVYEPSSHLPACLPACLPRICAPPQGFISYPRTETDQFDQNYDLRVGVGRCYVCWTQEGGYEGRAHDAKALAGCWVGGGWAARRAGATVAPA